MWTSHILLHTGHAVVELIANLNGCEAGWQDMLSVGKRSWSWLQEAATDQKGMIVTIDEGQAPVCEAGFEQGWGCGKWQKSPWNN